MGSAGCGGKKGKLAGWPGYYRSTCPVLCCAVPRTSWPHGKVLSLHGSTAVLQGSHIPVEVGIAGSSEARPAPDQSLLGTTLHQIYAHLYH